MSASFCSLSCSLSHTSTPWSASNFTLLTDKLRPRETKLSESHIHAQSQSTFPPLTCFRSLRATCQLTCGS